MSESRPSPRSVLLAALLLAVASLAGPAAAQWAWKDDNGRVVYSDRPPPSGVKSDKIVRQPSNAQTVLPSQPSGGAADTKAPATETRAASSGPKSLAEQEMEFRKRQQERADAEKKAQEEQTRASAKVAECERAKGYLRSLEEGGRIARTDSSGNREFLDDAQRAAEVDRTRKIVQSSCN
jgi:type IV secretory pathway VirB10-like protein